MLPFFSVSTTVTLQNPLPTEVGAQKLVIHGFYTNKICGEEHVPIYAAILLGWFKNEPQVCVKREVEASTKPKVFFCLL